MFNRNQNQLPGGPAQRVRGGTELPACISDQIAQIQPEEIAARKLMRDVKELLAANGQPTTINDKPAVATSYFYPEVVGGNEYYVRALERPDLAGNPLHGLVFDDTEDLKINTVDPDLIHFQEDPITGSITVGSGTRLGRDTDEQGLLNYSQTVVTALQTAVEAGKRTQAKELALRKQKRIDTIESVSRRARSVTLGALCLSLVGSGGYKIVTSDFWEGHDFHYDKKDYSLPVTSTAELGETIHPAFSSELVAAAGGGIADAPDLNDIYWDYKTNSIDDSSFTVDDGIRKITLTSSEKGHHCEIAPLEVDPPIGTKLSAWSSATHEDGTSRADEFDVTFTTESVLVCWNGEERNDEDDPLVYVRMIPPMK